MVGACWENDLIPDRRTVYDLLREWSEPPNLILHEGGKGWEKLWVSYYSGKASHPKTKEMFQGTEADIPPKYRALIAAQQDATGGSTKTADKKPVNAKAAQKPVSTKTAAQKPVDEKTAIKNGFKELKKHFSNVKEVDAKDIYWLGQTNNLKFFQDSLFLSYKAKESGDKQAQEALQRIFDLGKANPIKAKPVKKTKPIKKAKPVKKTKPIKKTKKPAAQADSTPSAPPKKSTDPIEIFYDARDAIGKSESIKHSRLKRIYNLGEKDNVKAFHNLTRKWENSAQDAAQAIYDLGRSGAKMPQPAKLRPPTPNQRAAVEYYTGNGYKKLRELDMRESGVKPTKHSHSALSGLDDDDIDYLEGKNKRLDAFLAKNSGHGDPVRLYRGAMHTLDFLKHVEVGNEFNFNAKTSFTEDQEIHLEFLESVSGRGAKKKFPVTFITTTNLGVNIASLSSFKEESEFLIPRNVQLTVQSIKKKGNQYTVILGEKK